MYAVDLDSAITTANGYSVNPLFNQMLFSQINLDPSKPHKIILSDQYTTAPPSWVDVDYMIVTAGDGNAE